MKLDLDNAVLVSAWHATRAELSNVASSCEGGYARWNAHHLTLVILCSKTWMYLVTLSRANGLCGLVDIATDSWVIANAWSGHSNYQGMSVW